MEKPTVEDVQSVSRIITTVENALDRARCVIKLAIVFRAIYGRMERMAKRLSTTTFLIPESHG
jgi:hypothetical protein